MGLLRKCTFLSFLVVAIFCIDSQMTQCYAQWHASYAKGLQAAEQGQWKVALKHFQDALKVKNKDKNKTRAYGTIFIEYYPNREAGICYFHLGDMERARHHLSLSMKQSATLKARRFLNRIEAGERPPDTIITQPPEEPEVPTIEEPDDTETDTDTTSPETATVVGERLSIAVLPFESKGIGRELGQIDMLDKLITGLVSIGRFKVIERTQLERILEEQQLGMSGIIDASTAAQIGKGIGVDAVMTGSITQGGNAVTIDARLIDTETAAIITARDAFCTGISLQSLSAMINDLATKFKNDFPIINGYVIGVEGTKLTLDIGLNHGIRKGTKCNVYREGAPIVHPVSGKVIGKMIDELCEVQVTEVFDAFSMALITKFKSGTPAIRDKVVTK